jgi:ABC-type amino acid transport substrate-binding protein
MRTTITLLSVLTLLVALAAAGSAGASPRSAAASFTYCTDPTFPPMEFTTTSGSITGFDADMATALA